VHDRPLVHRDDGFGRWWAVAQCTVWSLGVVVFPPAFDDGSGMCPGTIMSATEPYFSTLGGQNNGLGLSAAQCWWRPASA